MLQDLNQLINNADTKSLLCYISNKLPDLVSSHKFGKLQENIIRKKSDHVTGSRTVLLPDNHGLWCSMIGMELANF